MIATLALAAIPVFAQLSLADAQQRATANNVDAQVALAAVRRREASLHLARIGAVPHLIGDYSLSPQANAPTTGTVEQHYFAVGAGISINDLVGASNSIRAAAGDLLAAERGADAAGIAARENAVKLYFAALQAIALESFRSSALLGAQRDRNAADLRAHNGAAPQLDVVRADVTLAQAHADLARAQADRDDAIDALASATGIDPAGLSAVTAVPISAEPPLDVTRAVTRALAGRPELAALLATIEARNADVNAARQSWMPSTTIQGGYEKGVDTGIPVQGAQVAAHLDLPLASGSDDRVASAETEVDEAYAQLVDERRKIRLEVAAAVRDAQAQESAAKGADRARSEAERALTAVEIGYREGASSSLDVADARRTYDQASVDALVAEYQRAVAFAILTVIVP
jgi:cobalt-zinc-cadmium efflux system outer membrane protein